MAYVGKTAGVSLPSFGGLARRINDPAESTTIND